MLQEALDSAWHHPVVCFASVVILLSVIASNLSFRDSFVLFFSIEILADALMTGAFTPIPQIPNRTPYELVFFIVIGDFRYFLLVERYTPGWKPVRGFIRGIRWACLFPCICCVPIYFHWIPDMHHGFLFYEIGLFAIVTMFRLIIIPRRYRGEPKSEAQSFAYTITHFELLQYGLWMVGDILFFSGHTWGNFLRLVADVIYYGAFLPFAWLAIPSSTVKKKAPFVALAVTIAGVALSFGGVIAGGAHAAAPVASLTFMEHGKNTGNIEVDDFRNGTLPVATIVAIDPYYGREKRWHAVPIEALIQKGLHKDPATLTGADFVLRARDGYTTNISGARLLEGGAHVAYEDLDVPAWEPIGPQHAHPGPFYVVWQKPNQQDLKTHPRPWQLASIEIIDFDTTFPNVRPEGAAAGSPAALGFRTFRDRCIACHSINGSGGHVGPDLNVPRNILEYRPEPDVRAYIKNPRAFRYGTMPAHPDFTETNLDEIIAFLNAKKAQKHDPGAGPGHE